MTELLLHINSCGQAFCRTLRNGLNILMPRLEVNFKAQQQMCFVWSTGNLSLDTVQPLLSSSTGSSHEDRAGNIPGGAKDQIPVSLSTGC